MRKKSRGPQCVQNRRSARSSWKQSKWGVRDWTFDNIQSCVTATCSVAQFVQMLVPRKEFMSTFEELVLIQILEFCFIFIFENEVNCFNYFYCWYLLLFNTFVSCIVGVFKSLNWTKLDLELTPSCLQAPVSTAADTYPFQAYSKNPRFFRSSYVITTSKLFIYCLSFNYTIIRKWNLYHTSNSLFCLIHRMLQKSFGSLRPELWCIMHFSVAQIRACPLFGKKMLQSVLEELFRRFEPSNSTSFAIESSLKISHFVSIRRPSREAESPLVLL